MDPSQDPSQLPEATPDAPDRNTMEQIRLRRLAKLGTASPKPSEESGSSTKPEGTSTTLSAPTPEQRASPAAQASEKRKINVTPTPADKPQVSSSPSSTIPDRSHKRAAAKIDDRPQATQPATKKPNMAPEESIDDYTHRTVSSLFRITLNSSQTDDGHGHQTTFLPGVASELAEVGAPAKFTVAVLDTTLLEAATAQPHATPLLRYLLPCWKRVSRTLALLKDGEKQKREVLEEAKRLCMSYCLFALTIPDLFGRPQPDDLVTFLLRSQEHEDSISIDFTKDVISRFPEDEQYPAVFADAMAAISVKLSDMSMESDYRPYLNALSFYAKFPPLLRAVSEHEMFLSATTGPEVERKTILGPFFRLSPLQSEVSLTYFPNPRSLDKGRAAQSQDALRAILRVYQDELFAIANAFIRADSDTRNRMLDWCALGVNTNHKRRAIQVDPREVSSDGFMVNLTVILDRFCSPFMDTTFSKVDRIEVDYFRRNPRVSIKDETKINADQAASDAFYANADSKSSNFISEVFFLALAAHHYGSGATNSKLKSLDRDIKFYEKHITAMEAERYKLANVSIRNSTMNDVIANDNENPARLAMFEVSLKRHTDVLEKAIASKNAIEGVFLDDKMQELSLRFMKYVAVWMLRLASQSAYTPEKDLALPLPSPQPEAFACLPEYALQDVVDNFKFVYRYLPQIMPSAVGSEMIALCIAFLQSSEFIKNPYLKSSLVTLLFSGTWPFSHFKKGVLGDQLYGSKFANQHLLRALMKFYIEAESTGAHTQFYDKFNIRYEIFQVIKCVWGNDVYREQLARESKVNRQFFVQFVNLLLNDATYVLDEALTKFPKIHQLQAELEQNPGMTPEDREKKLEELQTLEGQAGSYMQLANETLAMMKLFTSALADAFTMPEIVQRLASMLNYNLETLAGPKMGQLKVNDPSKYHFQPRVLLSDFVDIYLNLANSQAFIDAVAADGRSYKPETFDKAGFILMKRHMKDDVELKKFDALKNSFKESKAIADQAELDLGEIPADFEDPILGDLMKDPVILPSQHVVDRSTIMQHLLSDPKDPFTRQPMTIEDVVPDQALRNRIEAWKAEKIEAAKAKVLGDSMDTTDG
ncbi:ubiquitin conjugation factor E4 [Verticillium alfalfae VaMs.102]|uniref:Ubiquitin conjugation factor E4 n=1 Tax=Verticillium alfalfae (strain VaMs.102 / ATCC MYA-4576 / FGSC 10136) TaxID=526221 RepID=C9SJS3_VERA1|nr:ubiquitin conjugation factor E4 [Verticillium alfalfae VaMs.102]EEY19687.1 ubiquitin conjugation factor E4 [Verticillium alfalfae VaMs.102]